MRKWVFFVTLVPCNAERWNNIIAFADMYAIVATGYCRSAWISASRSSFSIQSRELDKTLIAVDLSWQRVDSDLTGILIPVDDQLCGTPENSLQHICKAWQYDRPAHLAFSGANYRLIQSAPRVGLTLLCLSNSYLLVYLMYFEVIMGSACLFSGSIFWNSLPIAKLLEQSSLACTQHWWALKEKPF